MCDINKDIAKYEDLREELESKSPGKWALIHDTQLISTYDSFEETEGIAVAQFGKGHYLIRQIGAPAVEQPASV